jgi:hypothetical protein
LLRRRTANLTEKHCFANRRALLDGAPIVLLQAAIALCNLDRAIGLITGSDELPAHSKGTSVNR